jgi:hypothetical protein
VYCDMEEDGGKCINIVFCTFSSDFWTYSEPRRKIDIYLVLYHTYFNLVKTVLGLYHIIMKIMR